MDGLAAIEAFNEGVPPALYGFGVAAIIAETVYIVRTHSDRDVESRRLGVK